MPRKRSVEMTTTQITEEIKSIDEKIEKNTTETKELRIRKKELLKDLKVAEKLESEAAKKKEMEELAEFLKEKGLTIGDIRKILEEKENSSLINK